MSNISNLVSGLIGAILGAIISSITAIYLFFKKEDDEMKQRVYEPLRQELEINKMNVHNANENFAIQEWQRIFNQEHWSFKIKPEVLRKNLEHLYGYEFYNFGLEIGSAKKEVSNLLANSIGLKEWPNEDKNIIDAIVNNLVTGRYNMNLYMALNAFPLLKERHHLNYECYDEFRAEKIKIIEKSKYIQDYWQRKDQFYRRLNCFIKHLEYILGIKNKSQFS